METIYYYNDYCYYHYYYLEKSRHKIFYPLPPPPFKISISPSSSSSSSSLPLWLLMCDRAPAFSLCPPVATAPLHGTRKAGRKGEGAEKGRKHRHRGKEKYEVGSSTKHRSRRCKISPPWSETGPKGKKETGITTCP